ncbi:Gfo/Idh/MocA family protein [Endozoicomonas elysicola]|uniref:Oxidoreductase n=1 Tax=Endozoicomonas elysicola TaxID=305900 RepID=A0A081K9K5_9GAMM|nr:Gfo/Idh/MocA family oxidoreductase [Endozoicomonas elysicola]KEI70831.1 oxidoreductase [Endozoicomonas elysicola]
MRIGLIGLGDIAQKAYLPILTEFPSVEAVFCTRSRQVLSELAKKYRVNDFCCDYKQLLNMGVDAVMIHSATSTHVDIASYFLKNSIPVFVDKPLSTDFGDCERLHDLAESVRQPLFVGFNRRYLPILKEPLLQESKESPLLYFRWEKNRHNLPGAPRTFVFDDLIHPLDSVNQSAGVKPEDLLISEQMSNFGLNRLDIQWQAGSTLIQASMNRLNGITNERITLCYENQSYLFDSFHTGVLQKASREQLVRLPDWTPMLASKGFNAMIEHWLEVVSKGKLAEDIIARNLRTHLLAETICQQVEKQI